MHRFATMLIAVAVAIAGLALPAHADEPAITNRCSLSSGQIAAAWEKWGGFDTDDLWAEKVKVNGKKYCQIDGSTEPSSSKELTTILIVTQEDTPVLLSTAYITYGKSGDTSTTTYTKTGRKVYKFTKSYTRNTYSGSKSTTTTKVTRTSGTSAVHKYVIKTKGSKSSVQVSYSEKRKGKTSYKAKASYSYKYSNSTSTLKGSYQAAPKGKKYGKKQKIAIKYVINGPVKSGKKYLKKIKKINGRIVKVTGDEALEFIPVKMYGGK